MVFQDWGGLVRENGHTRVPIVFDNLIHRDELPVTVGLFVNPGVIPPAEPGNQVRKNRAFEYDTVDGQYANFIIEELIPHVVAEHDLKLTSEPSGHAICGNSSGGIAAFTAAWFRPDFFGMCSSRFFRNLFVRFFNLRPSIIKASPKDRR